MILCSLLIFLCFNLIKILLNPPLNAGLVSKMSSVCGNCQLESQARASDVTQFTYKSFNHSISRVFYVHSSRTTDESLLLRSSFRIPKRFRSLSICANAEFDCNTVARKTRTIRFCKDLIRFCKDLHQTLKYVEEFELKKMTKLKKRVHTHARTHAHSHTSLSLSFSLSLSSICRCTLIFPEGSACISLSLSIFICKNGLEPDQTRMEFRKECFVNLKFCVCDRKYTKCPTKAEAHAKMGFQF